MADSPALSGIKHTFGSKTFEMWAQRHSAGVCSEADANLTASDVGGGRKLIPQSAAGFQLLTFIIWLFQQELLTDQPPPHPSRPRGS